MLSHSAAPLGRTGPQPLRRGWGPALDRDPAAQAKRCLEAIGGASQWQPRQLPQFPPHPPPDLRDLRRDRTAKATAAASAAVTMMFPKTAGMVKHSFPNWPPRGGRGGAAGQRPGGRAHDGHFAPGLLPAGDLAGRDGLPWAFHCQRRHFLIFFPRRSVFADHRNAVSLPPLTSVVKTPFRRPRLLA